MHFAALQLGCEPKVPLPGKLRDDMTECMGCMVAFRGQVQWQDHASQPCGTDHQHDMRLITPLDPSLNSDIGVMYESAGVTAGDCFDSTMLTREDGQLAARLTCDA